MRRAIALVLLTLAAVFSASAAVAVVSNYGDATIADPVLPPTDGG